MAKETIRVLGLRDLQRAFALVDKEVSKELKSTLKAAAQPVATEAERLAHLAIKPGLIPWAGMRIGVTQKSVSVAPRRRRTVGTRRKNMATILMDRAMLPALQSEVDEVERSIDQMLATIGRKWESV